jgi:Na+-transporting NADH:ubiquinone oxidoreductase subunit A
MRRRPPVRKERRARPGRVALGRAQARSPHRRCSGSGVLPVTGPGCGAFGAASGRAAEAMATKFKGGCDVWLAGRPDAAVEVLPEPDELYLPLQSRRFTFSEVRVKDGERVRAGRTLAVDPANHSVPLLAPREGTARLGAVEGHVVLEKLTTAAEEPYEPGPDEEAAHAPAGMGSAGLKRYKLLTLGAWQFFQDAHTGALPHPFSTPRAVVVSTVRREPFVARGDVQMRKRLPAFTRGLEQVQSLLEYQPIYLVTPQVESEFARRVRETLRGYAWVEVVEIPLRYGVDHPEVAVQQLGLGYDRERPVWALGVDGVLAVDRALTLSRSSEVRIISLGGPAVRTPVHLKAVTGYPLRKILDRRLAEGPVRVINGGALTGRAVPAGQRGLDSECPGLTVLAEQEGRELLRFLRPGWGSRSYSNCFASRLRRARAEALTTAVRGEPRACVSCGSCEEVCPARIMPHAIHKLLYRDALEEAERLGLELCVRCGLCSFVCPSKIELRDQIEAAQDAARLEVGAAEGVE